jgi:hypothetical protein
MFGNIPDIKSVPNPVNDQLDDMGVNGCMKK